MNMDELIADTKAREKSINTKLGKFRFGWTSDKDWIWGCFDEPEKAKGVYDCNPYSGKHNFHGYWLGNPLNELMNHLEDMKQNNYL